MRDMKFPDHVSRRENPKQWTEHLSLYVPWTLVEQ